MENQAKRHYRAAGRNLARFAADLRRLQDGEAHLTRGFSSFGAYAEHTFDGLSAANAKKISGPRRRSARARTPPAHLSGGAGQPGCQARPGCGRWPPSSPAGRAAGSGQADGDAKRRP